MLVTMELDISPNHYRNLMKILLSFHSTYSQFPVSFPNLMQHVYHLCNNDYIEVGLGSIMETISQVSTDNVGPIDALNTLTVPDTKSFG